MLSMELPFLSMNFVWHYSSSTTERKDRNDTYNYKLFWVCQIFLSILEKPNNFVGSSSRDPKPVAATETHSLK